MKKTEAITRWSKQQFIEDALPTLECVFRRKNGDREFDIRGVTIGLDGSPPGFISESLQGANLNHVDASFANFSCSFWHAKLGNWNFTEASFDTCDFKSANLRGCNFEGSKIGSPLFDDAVFEGCHFNNSKISGRGHKEYGGRRTKFIRCSFQQTVFQNLQLRAVSFENCAFEAIVFRKCLLVGVRFEGASPPRTSFETCELQAVSFESEK